MLKKEKACLKWESCSSRASRLALRGLPCSESSHVEESPLAPAWRMSHHAGLPVSLITEMPLAAAAQHRAMANTFIIVGKALVRYSHGEGKWRPHAA